MKKILIVTAVLIIGAGSAGAGYYMMSHSAEANDAAEEETYVDPVKDPRYVEMDPLVLPVVENERIRHHMFVKLSLEVDGKATAQTVLEKKIRLHNAFYMALYDGAIQAPDSGGLNAAKVKSVVRQQARQVMGDDVVQAVRIQQAVAGQN